MIRIQHLIHLPFFVMTKRKIVISSKCNETKQINVWRGMMWREKIFSGKKRFKVSCAMARVGCIVVLDQLSNTAAWTKRRSCAVY